MSRHRENLSPSRCLPFLVPIFLAASGFAPSFGQVDAWFRSAGEAFSAGRFPDAVGHYRKTVTHFEQTGQKKSLAASLYNLATTYHAMGQAKQAFETLDRLKEVTAPLNDPVIARKTDALLATVAAFSRKSDIAKEHFEKSLNAAREADDTSMVAAIANDFGPFLAESGEHEKGLELIEESIRLSRAAGNRPLLAKALLNQALIILNRALADREEARTYGDAELAATVPDLLDQARDPLAGSVAAGLQLPDSHTKALLLISAGDAWREIGKAGGKPRAELTRQAFEAYSQALTSARSGGNRPAEAFALGSLAQLYESQERADEALELARSARQIAQELSLPDGLFLFEWQTARLLAAKGNRDEALEAYRRALSTLAHIRHDVAISHGKRRLGTSFRDAVGPLFFEFAGLLVEKAAQEGGDASADAPVDLDLLLEARDVIEQFKSAELEDFFQDDCVNLALEKQKPIDELDGKNAVFYLIPLKDRTEILVYVGKKIHRFTADWTRDQVRSAATQFRLALETRGSFSFISFAQSLYDAFIRPAETVLKESGVETLVFVPDGALRTVPMGALHDGEQFLTEKWAVAISPGLRLMDPKPVAWDRSELLIGAITQAVGDYPALEFVKDEIDAIQQNLTAETMMNEGFLESPFVSRVRDGSIRVVHIASHGEFGSDSRKSFVITFDDKINLDELEQMIKPRQFAGDPVELLTLSACRTAAGDDRAALGLAGVALKSGARSALATLWYVNDQAAATLVSQFYAELVGNPEISKAEALRRAQKTLIKDLRYRHPCYWSPYLIIGNWL